MRTATVAPFAGAFCNDVGIRSALSLARSLNLPPAANSDAAAQRNHSCVGLPKAPAISVSFALYADRQDLYQSRFFEMTKEF